MSSLGAYISQYSDFLTLSDDGVHITCSLCKITFQCNRKRDVNRHINSKRHNDNAPSEVPSNNTVFSELCKAFVSANIPLHKLNNVELKKFLEKYCGRKIPHESTLRKYYLPRLYDRKISEIREYLKDKYLWISVDEITDVQGRTIGNVIVGPLHPDKSDRSFLIACKVLEDTNAETIISLVCGNLDVVTFEKETKVLLLVTNSAAYMLEAGRELSTALPRMIHITCFADALHRVCNYVREEFSNVDKLISETQIMCLRSSSWQEVFKLTCPRLQPPPQPITTRWGTWLEAAVDYADNYKEIKQVLSTAKSVHKCKNLVNNPSLPLQLNLIKERFGKIPAIIVQLESQKLPLPDAVKLFNTTLNNLQCPGDFGRKLSRQIEDVVIKQNPGYQKLCEISTMLRTKGDVDETLKHYRYAPVTSCEVERSFSLFKYVASCRRHFTTDNIDTYMVLYHNTCDSQ